VRKDEFSGAAPTVLNNGRLLLVFPILPQLGNGASFLILATSNNSPNCLETTETDSMITGKKREKSFLPIYKEVGQLQEEAPDLRSPHFAWLLLFATKRSPALCLSNRRHGGWWGPPPSTHPISCSTKSREAELPVQSQIQPAPLSSSHPPQVNIDSTGGGLNQPGAW
jgi:hypothetical protein